MARGLLVAAFDFATAHADEFHDWYDLEHIPERQAVPGFGQTSDQSLAGGVVLLGAAVRNGQHGDVQGDQLALGAGLRL